MLPRLKLLSAALLLLALGCASPTSQRIERKVDALAETQQRMLHNQDLTLAGLDELVALARRQGTGEITLFYPWASAQLPPAQAQRLVLFLDRLSYEAHGRELVLVSVGSANDWWREDWNQNLSARRAQGPMKRVHQHLVNTPHRVLRRYGVGQSLAEEGQSPRQWRHARIIAVYAEEQLPELPERGGAASATP